MPTEFRWSRPVFSGVAARFPRTLWNYQQSGLSAYDRCLRLSQQDFFSYVDFKQNKLDGQITFGGRDQENCAADGYRFFPVTVGGTWTLELNGYERAKTRINNMEIKF